MTNTEQVETMPADMQLKFARESVAVRLYKLITRASRVTTAFYWIVNTGSRKQRGCVLCGKCCPGFSAKYTRTKQSLRWESEHDCTEAYLAGKGISGELLARAIALACERTTASGEVLEDMLRTCAAAWIS